MNRSIIQIEDEYLKIKGGDFSNWYSKLTKVEKLRFNTVLLSMRDKFHKNKSNDPQKS
jgi:hypothetical protein|tara:strand:+ start:809 stop:982 length:174 start_codon:yes stop_codon:yes gene_type:complete